MFFLVKADDGKDVVEFRLDFLGLKVGAIVLLKHNVADVVAKMALALQLTIMSLPYANKHQYTHTHTHIK